MARSFKHHPYGGMTKCESEKLYKVLERRRARRATNMGEDVHPRQFGNPWYGPKDGKVYYGFDYPGLLRK